MDGAGSGKVCEEDEQEVEGIDAVEGTVRLVFDEECGSRGLDLVLAAFALPP